MNSTTPDGNWLRPGQRVRVKTGSLTGVEGVVVSRRGEDCLLLAVECLQKGVSIQIDENNLERLHLDQNRDAGIVKTGWA
jgi:hypothetical protein